MVSAYVGQVRDLDAVTLPAMPTQTMAVGGGAAMLTDLVESITGTNVASTSNRRCHPKIWSYVCDVVERRII